MFNKKRHVGILSIIVLSLFLLQLSPALAQKSTTSSKAQTATKSLTSVSTDATDIETAKAALADAAILNPVEGTDTNVIKMAQAIVNGVSSGVVVTVYNSSNRAVSKSGAITYSSSLKKGNVTFKLTKNRAAATQSMSVVVPAEVVIDPDVTEVATAKAALADAATLNPVEGTDTNVIAMAQEIVDGVSSGVVVTIYNSSNRAVSKSGAITYSSSLKKGNVTFKLTKNRAAATQSMSVVVPAEVVIDPDVTEIAAAKSALADAATLNPVEGTDTNVVTMAQTIVDGASSGVEVTITSSDNAQVAADGAITYGSSEVSGKVSFTLTKNDAVDRQSITVDVPAQVVIDLDATAVATAKAAVTSTGTLKPIEGKDINVVSMVQAIVNSASSGVTVKITVSANTKVAADGKISYGDSDVTDYVTFSLTKNQASSSAEILVAVPATVLKDQVNVMNFGAKGDGITDDTAAIQKAIDYASSNFIDTVIIPDGTFMINPTVSVKLKSKIKLNLSDNATLKAIPTSSGHYDVILIQNVNNVSVVGGNIIGERYSHLSINGDHGMGIGIYDSSYVTITDISISDCLGDGIYLGSNSESGYNSNVDIERFTCDNNRRMGLTIISAKNLTIRDGVCSNTNGTEPQSGLDLEPNYATQILQNVLIDNLKTINNGGYGLDFWLSQGTSEVPLSNVSVIIKNHTDSGSAYGTLHDISKYISRGYNITVI
jgi:Endopolygalacturonase